MRASDGRLVHVNDVQNGRDCGCVWESHISLIKRKATLVGSTISYPTNDKVLRFSRFQ